MSEWKEYKIGEKCTVGDGAHASITRVDNGIPYLTSKNFKQEGIDLSDLSFISKADYEKHFRANSKALTKPETNDLILSIIGSIGAPYLVRGTDKFGISSSVAIIRPSSEIDSKYLYFYLKTSGVQYYVEAIKSGSAQGFLSIGMIKSIPIKYPLIDEQKLISSILSAYDKLIENNNRRITILEQMAEQIYKEWFVRMRFPDYEKADFEKGIPKGWSIQTLNDIAEITSSKRIFLSDYVKEGIPFYRGKEISMKSKNKTIEDLLYIDTNKFIELKSRFGAPNVGEILLTAVGTIGNVHLVNDNDGDFYFKDGNLIWLRKIRNQELSLFLYSLFITKEFNNQLDLISIGSSQKALTIAIVKKINILIPNSKLLEDYFSLVKPMYLKIKALQKQTKNLKQTRDLLLPRLISGKLQTKN